MQRVFCLHNRTKTFMLVVVVIMCVFSSIISTETASAHATSLSARNSAYKEGLSQAQKRDLFKCAMGALNGAVVGLLGAYLFRYASKIPLFARIAQEVAVSVINLFRESQGIANVPAETMAIVKPYAAVFRMINDNAWKAFVISGIGETVLSCGIVYSVPASDYWANKYIPDDSEPDSSSQPSTSTYYTHHHHSYSGSSGTGSGTDGTDNLTMPATKGLKSSEAVPSDQASLDALLTDPDRVTVDALLAHPERTCYLYTGGTYDAEHDRCIPHPSISFASKDLAESNPSIANLWESDTSVADLSESDPSSIADLFSTSEQLSSDFSDNSAQIG